MKRNWSELRPLPKLDQHAGIFIITAIHISEGHHIVTIGD